MTDPHGKPASRPSPMTRRRRLMATLRGEPVDRPAVSFYEIGGWRADPADPDPFNVFNAPSWAPLLRLAEERTDIMRMAGPALRPRHPALHAELISTRTWTEGGTRHTLRAVRAPGGRVLTSRSRRDAPVNTVWTVEHLLKDAGDLHAFLALPPELWECEVDIAGLERAEEEVGERGIVMVDTGDPLCAAAELFSLADYTVLALTEPRLFHRLLEKVAPPIHARTEEVARRFPGRLWRICGPEYATEPYLPPWLFAEYVVRHTGPMVAIIRRHGGFARIHCHGRLRAVLPMIAAMGADGLDPVEPPPQGDVTLRDVRREHGGQMVLFGNIEASAIETLAPPAFEALARQALAEGTAGPGRGFVLMPSACPCGREISPRVLANYATMARLAEEWGG